MYTIIESAIFARKADVLLSNESREALAVYLALIPNAVVLITVFSKRRREGFSKKELMLSRKAFDDDN